MHTRIIRGAAALLTVVASAATIAGQSARPDAASLSGTDSVKTFIASRVQKNWTPPKTPWGDPDISGVFTTKDEANTPFERPDEWAGRKMDDITAKEFAEAIASRQALAVETAPFAGGGEPDAGVAIAVPIHWFDNLAAKNSRPWFVVDPPEGKVPPLTAEARNRPVSVASPGSSAARGLDKETVLRGGKRDTYLDRYLG